MTTWRIGPRRTYPRFYNVLNYHYGTYRVADGDTVLVDAAEYVNDPIYIRNSITVKAVGGRVRIFWKENVQIVGANGPTLTYTSAQMDTAPADKTKEIHIYDFDFCGPSDGRFTGSLGYLSSFRHIGGKVYLHNCNFYNCSNGIMTLNESPAISELHLINCGFGGSGGSAEGYAHNIYVGRIAKFTMTGCYSHDARCGHLIKSRAARTELWYNRFTDEAGWASHQIDCPNGGILIAVGNIVQKGQATNPTVIAYGVEGYVGAGGVPWPANEIYLINNTVICTENPGGGNTPVYVTIGSGLTPTKKIMNNVAYGVSGIAPWPTSSGFSNNFNLTASDIPGLASHDFRLTELNGWGTTLFAFDPGVASDGTSLKPLKEYVHPQKTRTAPVIYIPGAVQTRVDVGAAPTWSPAPGEIKQISHPAGYFGTNGGATLAEISPNYQAWNPEAPGNGPYNDPDSYGYYWSSINSYSGICWNKTTRQLVNYGAGHSAINVCAPFCFDVNELRWKWLDTPLPFDGYGRVLAGGYSAPPSQATINLLYPNGEVDYTWGDVNGDSSAWYDTYGDGPWIRPGVKQPVPSHTRSHLGFVPPSIIGNTKGALFKFGPYSGVLGGVNSVGSHLFNFDTASWRRTVNQPPGSSSSFVSPVIDEKTKTAVAFIGGNVFKVFDFVTDSWRSLRISSNSVAGSVDSGSCIWIESVRLILIIAARNSSGGAADNNGVTFDFYTVPYDDVIGSGLFSITKLNVYATSWPLSATTGTNAWIGFSRCPENDACYCVNGDTNSTKYWRLSPPSGLKTATNYTAGEWTLTEQAFSTGTLNSPGGRSYVYNRLSWDALSRSFLWFPNSVTGVVQAFRPGDI